MSRIDRRAFATGCLAVIVAGCGGGTKKSLSGTTKSCVAPPAGVSFLTPGCWTQMGNTLVYVVT